MRVKTFYRVLRLLSAVVLFFFIWTFGPVWQAVAFAATSPKADVKAQTIGKPEAGKQKPDERFEDVLAEMREKVTRAGEKHAKGQDDTAEREAIKAERASIYQISEELRAEFSSTEKRLKTAVLPKTILARHTDFVANFERNVKELHNNLDEIESAKTKAGRVAKIEKARLHLEKTRPPRHHTPLNPDQLPNRNRKATKTVEPRLKKEDYERDFPQQKPRNKHKIADSLLLPDHRAGVPKQKPILLAFNEFTSDIPFSLGVESASPQLAFSDPSPFLLAQAAAQPTVDDLAETPEVQFTDAINAKAQELGCSPVRIYEEIRNSIEFVPTYGSIQGADMCLQTKQCNATDTSSLLISLLRSCNIPAHYVYSTVEIPIDKAMNWVGGFTDPRAAITFISSGGIPIKAYALGGVINKIQMEHVSVETYVPYGPYSGRSSNLNVDKIWVPLDPSFKQYTYTEGVDLQAAVPFDAQAFANQIQSTATISETAGYVTNMDSNYIQATMTDYQTQIQNYINQNMPNATAGDIIGKKEIKKQELGILPVTLPYKTITIGTKYSETPDNLRHKVTIEVQNSSATGNSLSYTTSIPEIAGKRVTLSYAPATAADEQVINNYSGILNVPAYLVNMKPQIKIEGVAMATGNTIGLGNQQAFNMKFASPSGDADSVVSNNITVGAYYGIGVNPSKITKELINKRRAKLEAVQSTVSDSTIYTDDYIGELIYTTAMAYFFELDALTDVMAQKYKIADLKHVSEAIVSKDINVFTSWGVPLAVADASMMIDVDRLIHSAVDKNGDQAKERRFTIMAGQMSSAMEHGIFEQMYKAKGVSTMQVLQLANSQGIPIYTLTSTNISSVLPNLQISNEVKTDIQNAINSGKNVVIPQQNITYYGWTGVGFIVMDPITGSGAYMISTNLAGGGQCLAAGGLSIVFLSLISATSPWYSFSCQITTLMHYFSSPIEFLGLAGVIGGAGLVLLIESFEMAAGIGALLLGGMGLFVLLFAAIAIVFIIRGLVDSYSHHVHNYYYKRRVYGARYIVKTV